MAVMQAYSLYTKNIPRLLLRADGGYLLKKGEDKYFLIFGKFTIGGGSNDKSLLIS